MYTCTGEFSFFSEEIYVVVEHSTYVCYAVGSKVVSSIPHVTEIPFSQIYFQTFFWG